MVEPTQPGAAPPRYERVFAVGLMLLATNALIPLLSDPSGTSTDPSGNGTLQALWIAIYAVVAFLIYRRRVPMWPRLVADPALLVLLFLALLSTMWSDAPGITIRRSVALGFTVLVALYVAQRFSRSDLLDLVLATLGIAVILSFVFALAMPRYGIDPTHAGAWRGVFETKNELGRLAAIASALWVVRATSVRRRRLLASLMAGACVVATIESGSRTSLVVSLAAVGILLMLPFVRADSYFVASSMMFALGGAILLGAYAFTHIGTLLHLFGASSTLTGRTSIWAAVWSSIQHRFWFGYGYSGFWLGPNSAAAAVAAQIGTMPAHSHNGELDVWLQLGAVGVAAFAVWFVFGVRSTWRLMRAGEITDAWPFLFIGLLFVSNLTESDLIARNSFFWMIAVAAVAQSRLRAEEPAALATVSDQHETRAPSGRRSLGMAGG